MCYCAIKCIILGYCAINCKRPPHNEKSPGASIKDDIESLPWGAELNWSVILGLFVNMLGQYFLQLDIIIALFVLIAKLSLPVQRLSSSIFNCSFVC